MQNNNVPNDIHKKLSLDNKIKLLDNSVFDAVDNIHKIKNNKSRNLGI